MDMMIFFELSSLKGKNNIVFFLRYMNSYRYETEITKEYCHS